MYIGIYIYMRTFQSVRYACVFLAANRFQLNALPCESIMNAHNHTTTNANTHIRNLQLFVCILLVNTFFYALFICDLSWLCLALRHLPAIWGAHMNAYTCHQQALYSYVCMCVCQLYNLAGLKAVIVLAALCNCAYVCVCLFVCKAASDYCHFLLFL